MKKETQWGLLLVSGLVLCASVLYAERHPEIALLSFLHDGRDPTAIGWAVIAVGFVLTCMGGVPLHQLKKQRR